jgi:hypothetical protein
MQKSKITDRKREYEIKEVQELCHTAWAWTTILFLQTTVIDGAGFGQPGTTIQAAFGQNGTTGVFLIKPCTTKLYL